MCFIKEKGKETPIHYMIFRNQRAWGLHNYCTGHPKTESARTSKFCFFKQIKVLGKHRNSVPHCGDHSNCICQDRGGKNQQMKALFYLSLHLQQLQEMDERRTIKLSECYKGFADSERKVIPIISKCLEGMILAAKSVDEHRVSRTE